MLSQVEFWVNSKVRSRRTCRGAGAEFNNCPVLIRSAVGALISSSHIIRMSIRVRCSVSASELSWRDVCARVDLVECLDSLTRSTSSAATVPWPVPVAPIRIL
ncbi:hypothetical protein CBL_13861 [Carabus blaptoides fortunei]